MRDIAENGYQIGGSLPETATTYIVRQADEILYRSLLAGEFCSVLNARQMGKSSLVVQTIKRLRQEGITCITLDLSDLGSQQVSLEQWYGGVAFKLLSSLQLFSIQEFILWWQAHQNLSPLQRLGELLHQVIFPGIAGKIVIFIDEIDSVLSVQEPLDDFFSWIRSCYNQRAFSAEYQRLTFTLLGVATPSDLIQDPQRTPFNIGTAIDLQPFTLGEIAPLAEGFNLSNATLCQALLGEILEWTGGQPFLTQKLCAIVSKALLDPSQTNQWAIELKLDLDSDLDSDSDLELDLEQIKSWVKTIVQTEILDYWETQDEPIHLRTIRNRLLRHLEQGNRLLDLYDRVLQQGTLPLANRLEISLELSSEISPEVSQLRLSGIVRCVNGNLQVYNPIYAHIFSRDWINGVIQSLRPYGETLQAWIQSHQTDDSRLLRGQALVDALAWAVNKHLSPTDYQFLAASRDLALQESQHREVEGQREIERLHREKELLEQLAQAQEQGRLAELKLRRQQWQRRVSITGSIASMLAFLCGVIWMQINTQSLTLRLNRWLQLGEAMLIANKPEIALFYGLEAARLHRGAVAIDAKVELRLWLLLDRSQRMLAETPLNSISNPDTSSETNPSPDSPQLVLTPNGVVQQWAGQTVQRSITVRHPPLPPSFTIVPSAIVPSPVLPQFALHSPENPTLVEIWDFQEGLQGYLPHPQPVIASAWSRDGKLFATLTTSPSPQLTLWYQDFSPVAQFPLTDLITDQTKLDRADLQGTGITEQKTIGGNTGQLFFTGNATVLDFQLGYQAAGKSMLLLDVHPSTAVQQACRTFQRPSLPSQSPSIPLPDGEPSLQRFCKTFGHFD